MDDRCDLLLQCAENLAVALSSSRVWDKPIFASFESVAEAALVAIVIAIHGPIS